MILVYLSIVAALLGALSGACTGLVRGIEKRTELPDDGKLHSYELDHASPLHRPMTMKEMTVHFALFLLSFAVLAIFIGVEVMVANVVDRPTLWIVFGCALFFLGGVSGICTTPSLEKKQD